MGAYSVAGVTSATSGATTDLAIATLWHPSGTGIAVRVLEVLVFKQGTTGPRVTLERATARGTAGSTVTPDADNAWEADSVPASGVLLDVGAYSAQPTTVSPALQGLSAFSVSGGGWGWTFPSGLILPSNEGLALVAKPAVVQPVSYIVFVWEEGSA